MTDPTEAARRYRHVRRRGWSEKACAQPCPGTKLTCSREVGHRGPHVAHTLFGTPRAAWERTARERKALEERGRQRARRSSAPGDGRRPAPRRPVGLRSRRPAGFLESLGRRLLRVVSDVEQLALLLLFLAFAGFAVHWLTLILG